MDLLWLFLWITLLFRTFVDTVENSPHYLQFFLQDLHIRNLIVMHFPQAFPQIHSPYYYYGYLYI